MSLCAGVEIRFCAVCCWFVFALAACANSNEPCSIVEGGDVDVADNPAETDGDGDADADDALGEMDVDAEPEADVERADEEDAPEVDAPDGDGEAELEAEAEAEVETEAEIEAETEAEIIVVPDETLVTLDGLRVVRLKGSAYVRGYRLGAVLGDQIMEFYQSYLLDYVAQDFADDVALARMIVEAMVDLTDEQDAMLHGIADAVVSMQDTAIMLPDGTAATFGFQDIVLANIISDIAMFGCSSASAWGSLTADGETVVARNLDWDAGPDQMLGTGTVVVSETPEDESWQLVLVTWPGMIGCHSCMNGDGQAAFIHDSRRYGSGIVYSGLEPRSYALRKALLAAEGSSDPFTAFEYSLETSAWNSGNNFHFVTPHKPGRYAGACFETNDQPDHPDGFATFRTPLDTAVNGLDNTETMLVTNHFRKRSDTISAGWRYGELIQSLGTCLDPQDEDNPSADGVIDLADIVWMVNQVELGTTTVHTIGFKPATKTLIVHASGPGVLASEAPGVTVPWETLFPW